MGVFNYRKMQEGRSLSERELQLSETFLRIVKEDHDYAIFLLEGDKLIFFPA